MNKDLRYAAKHVLKWCEEVTCEKCPYHNPENAAGMVCELNAARLKREADEYDRNRPKTAGRPIGSANRVRRKKDSFLHLAMNNETKEKLRELAAAKGMSLTDIVEDMIDYRSRHLK